MEVLYFKSVSLDCNYYKAIYVLQGDLFPFTITETKDNCGWMYERNEMFINSEKRMSLEELTSDSTYWGTSVMFNLNYKIL